MPAVAPLVGRQLRRKLIGICGTFQIPQGIGPGVSSIGGIRLADIVIVLTVNRVVVGADEHDIVVVYGSLDIGIIPSPAVVIMDIKTPDSLMSERMDWENIED